MGGDGGSPAGTLPGLVRTGATFADAAAEWLRYIEHDSQSKAVDRRRLVHCAQLVEGWPDCCSSPQLRQRPGPRPALDGQSPAAD